MRKKLTANNDPRDTIADSPNTLRNIGTKFLDDACKIVTHDSAILGLPECTSKSLPWI